MRNKVREKMLVFFVLENPLKSLHKDFVYRTLKENFELDDKTLGYDFRPESFFPTSWGGSRLYQNLKTTNGDVASQFTITLLQPLRIKN